MNYTKRGFFVMKRDIKLEPKNLFIVFDSNS